MGEAFQALLDDVCAANRAAVGGRAMDYAPVEQDVGRLARAVERGAHQAMLQALDVDAAKVVIVTTPGATESGGCRSAATTSWAETRRMRCWCNSRSTARGCTRLAAAGVGTSPSSDHTQGSSADGESWSTCGKYRCSCSRSLFVSRFISWRRSSSARPTSRSSITNGSSIRTRRKQPRSVRSESARTYASRRSSFAPATVCRSRNRSSCFGLQ
jgi:hypothetical protein